VLCLRCRAGEQQKKATGTRLINRSGISGGLLRGDRGRSGGENGEHLSVWSLLSVLLCLAVGRDLFCVVSEEEGLRGRNGRYWRDG